MYFINTKYKINSSTRQHAFYILLIDVIIDRSDNLCPNKLITSCILTPKSINNSWFNVSFFKQINCIDRLHE